MAFTQSNTAKNNTPAQSPARENNVGGYLNIAVVGRDGQARRLGQGGRGIALREDHPVEGAVLKFIREHGVDALTEKLTFTFGDAAAAQNFEL